MIRINDPFHITLTVFYVRPERRGPITALGLLIIKDNAVGVSNKRKQMINAYLKASVSETRWNANVEVERQEFSGKENLLYRNGGGYIIASILACCLNIIDFESPYILVAKYT